MTMDPMEICSLVTSHATTYRKLSFVLFAIVWPLKPYSIWTASRLPWARIFLNYIVNVPTSQVIDYPKHSMYGLFNYRHLCSFGGNYYRELWTTPYIECLCVWEGYQHTQPENTCSCSFLYRQTCEFSRYAENKTYLRKYLYVLWRTKCLIWRSRKSLRQIESMAGQQTHHTAVSDGVNCPRAWTASSSSEWIEWTAFLIVMTPSASSVIQLAKVESLSFHFYGELFIKASRIL